MPRPALNCKRFRRLAFPPPPAGLASPSQSSPLADGCLGLFGPGPAPRRLASPFADCLTCARRAPRPSASLAWLGNSSAGDRRRLRHSEWSHLSWTCRPPTAAAAGQRAEQRAAAAAPSPGKARPQCLDSDTHSHNIVPQRCAPPLLLQAAAQAFVQRQPRACPLAAARAGPLALRLPDGAGHPGGTGNACGGQLQHPDELCQGAAAAAAGGARPAGLRQRHPGVTSQPVRLGGRCGACQRAAGRASAGRGGGGAAGRGTAAQDARGGGGEVQVLVARAACCGEQLVEGSSCMQEGRGRSRASHACLGRS